MQVKQWIYSKKESNVRGIIPQLLACRGIISEQEQKDFLYPLDMTLIHPSAFTDMDKAVDRITLAISNNENIIIYGDFDSDGMTSTSLLVKTLKELGANVDYYIPDRELEGHGLNTSALVKILSKNKPKLLITVDCGISNYTEVDFLKSFKVDTIITDHHEAPEELPNAFAIINPKAINSLSEKLDTTQINYLASLAGVGVAFKLAQALLINHKKSEFVYKLLPLVAVGTIGDIVPLIGENRYFVKKGLELIQAGSHSGLTKLLSNCGYNSEKDLTAEQVAFGIVPRLNASGRLENVESAMKVLLSDNPAEISIASSKLEELNRVRQELCSLTYNQAINQLTDEDYDNNAVILYNPDWEVGIIGIAASKMVETFYKPAFLMTYSQSSKLIKCSARGVIDLNIYEILSSISDNLEGFGGHKLAGGFSFNPEYISFENLKTMLNQHINELTEGKKLTPKLDVDFELHQTENGSGLDFELIENLDLLEPYGASNPRPVFTMSGLKIAQKKLMGENKTHLKLVLDKNGEQFQCVRWGLGDIPLELGDTVDIAFSPQINIFNNVSSIQLVIKDIHSDKLNEVVNSVEDDSVVVHDNRKKTDIFNQVEAYIKSTKMNVKVFAENNSIIEKLSPYKHISANIFNRLNLNKSDVIMFFDYPPSDLIMSDIIKQCSPKVIHYMRYDLKNIDYSALLKTLSGMLKYSNNKKAGKFEIKRAACFLAVTVESLNFALDCFLEAKSINILSSDEEFCTISYIQDVDLSAISKTKSFPLFIDSLENINSYRFSVCE